MKKVADPNPLNNDYCPQTLFVYGTYREDGTPNFGLFCWFSYCWDGEVKIMACIGGEKLTKDRIRETKVFSANLVSEAILPMCDYFGSVTSYESPEKMKIPFESARGEALNVPILADSPVGFELEVERTTEMDDGTLFVCKIRNRLVDERLLDETASLGERVKLAAPVLSVNSSYFSAGVKLGNWGDWKEIKQ